MLSGQLVFLLGNPIQGVLKSVPAGHPPGVLLHPIFISHSVGDTMKFRPLHDRVVVKRIDAEDKSAGGIIIQRPSRSPSWVIQGSCSIQSSFPIA